MPAPVASSMCGRPRTWRDVHVVTSVDRGPDITHEHATNGDLERHARSIPSMGGRGIAATLRAVAAEAASGTAIVEVGSWMGASAARLAMGLGDAGRLSEVTIHCFDRWNASGDEVAKAARHGIELAPGDDLLPLVEEHLAPFGASVVFHKGDVRAAAWDGTPVSVHVDDAAKTPIPFFHVLRTFGPSWIPGATIVVLMDYFLYEKRTAGSRLFRCQRDFIEANAEHFEPWGDTERPRSDKSAAVFRYVRELDFDAATATPAARRLVRREQRVRRVERLLRRGRG